jgi:hypothetical protein
MSLVPGRTWNPVLRQPRIEKTEDIFKRINDSRGIRADQPGGFVLFRSDCNFPTDR